MPELPEVETIRRGVAKYLTGQTVHHVALHTARVSRHESNLGAYAALEGKTVTEIARRGKFLWIIFGDSSRALMFHLGMSGQLLYVHSEAPPRHAAATLEWSPLAWCIGSAVVVSLTR